MAIDIVATIMTSSRSSQRLVFIGNDLSGDQLAAGGLPAAAGDGPVDADRVGGDQDRPRYHQGEEETERRLEELGGVAPVGRIEGDAADQVAGWYGERIGGLVGIPLGLEIERRASADTDDAVGNQCLTVSGRAEGDDVANRYLLRLYGTSDDAGAA